MNSLVFGADAKKDFKKQKHLYKKGMTVFWGEVCVALYRAYAVANMSYQMVSTVTPGLCKADRNDHWLWPVAT